VSASSLTIGDRRRLALERLQAKRRHPSSRGPATEVPAGPAPAAFYAIAVVVALFVMLGLVMVFSASAPNLVADGGSPYRIFQRQAMWAVFGLAGLVLALKLPLRWWRRISIPLLVAAFGAMALAFTPGLGSSVNGARAWIRVGGWSMQPSELLKLAVLVVTAHLLAHRHRQIRDSRRSIVPVTVIAGAGAIACLAQGDLGSAVVLAAIVMAVAFVAGAPAAPLGMVGLMGIAGALLFALSDPRRYNRFTAFLDVKGNRDWLSYQTWQGYVSIANGGLAGSGIGSGKGKLGYLPLAHSDFIFAVIADELGLIGVVAVLGGFSILVWCGVQIALAAPDHFSAFVAGGIAAWFGVQTIVNLGGVVGLLPVTGLTLPFFSAGGTSLFVSMAAAGLLLNVARRAR
jgi:cell division protein FtsW